MQYLLSIEHKFYTDKDLKFPTTIRDIYVNKPKNIYEKRYRGDGCDFIKIFIEKYEYINFMFNGESHLWEANLYWKNNEDDMFDRMYQIIKRQNDTYYIYTDAYQPIGVKFICKKCNSNINYYISCNKIDELLNNKWSEDYLIGYHSDKHPNIKTINTPCDTIMVENILT